jgi:hypothetical protein
VRSACRASHYADLIVIDMRIISQGNHERFDIISLPRDHIVRQTAIVILIMAVLPLNKAATCQFIVD